MSNKKEDFSNAAACTAIVSSIVVGVIVTALTSSAWGHLADIATFVGILMVMD